MFAAILKAMWQFENSVVRGKEKPKHSSECNILVIYQVHGYKIWVGFCCSSVCKYSVTIWKARKDVRQARWNFFTSSSTEHLFTGSTCVTAAEGKVFFWTPFYFTFRLPVTQGSRKAGWTYDSFKSLVKHVWRCLRTSGPPELFCGWKGRSDFEET